jgi:hypothetical protein
MARHSRHRPPRLSTVIAAAIAPPGTARHIFYREYISLLDARANFGRPSFNDNLAYQPRMLQLGFRTTF